MSILALRRSVVLLAPGQEWFTSCSSSVCPSGTKMYFSGSAIACGIQEPSTPTCIPFTYPAVHSYSKIMWPNGRIPKGLNRFLLQLQQWYYINGNYVDGVTIVRGFPRQHVWTYTILTQENTYHKPSNTGTNICPCGATSLQQVPSFVGSDY